MKRNFLRIFSLTLSSLIAASCSNSNNANLKGNLELDHDTIIVKSMKMDRSEIATDTIVLKEGNFDTVIADSVPLWLNIIPMPRNEEDKKTLFPATVMMLPGDNITLSGTLENLSIRGSKLYDALEGTDYYETYKENEILRRRISKVYKTVTDETRKTLDSLLDVSQEMDKRLNELGMALVKKAPDNIASAFATLKMFDKESLEACEMLSSNIKNGIMKDVINFNIAARQKSLEKQKEWDNIKEGMPAPDFKLKNLYGEEKSLASFKGKYVVLEFWGTWCPWCIKGLPMMRTYYAKYKRDVEFVSISCRDNEQAWRKCIEKYGLTWTQLYNGDDKEILKSYGILGFPSKIIIGKDGKIVDKFLDEEKTFYQKLDEMFAK